MNPSDPNQQAIAERAAAAVREACLGPLADLIRLRAEIEESRAVEIESATRRGYWIAGMILQFLESQPRVIDGAGMALAPGTVADASRSVEWWRRDRGGKVRNVAYDFNPGSISYYDYASLPWFQVIQQQDTPIMVGPYIDVGNLEVSIITLAAPVRPARLHMIGCDVSLGILESIFVRAIRATTPPFVLANGSRRVLASNTATFTIGDLAPQSAASDVPVFQATDEIKADWVVRLGV